MPRPKCTIKFRVYPVASAERTRAFMILPCRPIQTAYHVASHANHSHILLTVFHTRSLHVVHTSGPAALVLTVPVS